MLHTIMDKPGPFPITPAGHNASSAPTETPASKANRLKASSLRTFSDQISRERQRAALLAKLIVTGQDFSNFGMMA